jgi:hypothetical protein
MSLKVVGGRLDLSPDGIVCQLDDGAAKVVCTITRKVLRDLGDHHQLGGSEERLFSHLLLAIEQLASRKFNAGRIDKDGALTIETADLLRYGRTVLRTVAPTPH